MCGTPRLLALAALVSLLATGLPVADGSHNDGAYDQPAWFTWNTTNIDILIIPPAHGQVWNGNGALGGLDPFEATIFNDYLDAILTGIADWERAINTYGSTQLRQNLQLNTYVVGLDVPAPSAVVDPEIVIHTSASKAFILGVAVRAGNYCVIDNSKFFVQSYTYNDMYSVAAHETGHCLGLDHTGGDHPVHDLMDGGYDDPVGNPNNHRHCMSNLNVFGLERVYGSHWGGPSGGTVSVPVGQYQTIGC